MSTQEPTWRENAWIRLRHIWWFFPAWGVSLLFLLITGDGFLGFLFVNVTMFFFCVHLAWLSLKGIGCKPDRVYTWLFMALALGFALLSGFIGFIFVYPYLFGNG